MGVNLRRSLKHWRASVPHRYEVGKPGDIPSKEYGHVELPKKSGQVSVYLWNQLG